MPNRPRTATLMKDMLTKGMHIMSTRIMIMLAIILRMTMITTIMGMASTSTTTVIPMLMTTTSAPADAALMGADAGALYRLMTWLSPAFPVGGFSYSSGIEWAVEAGDISDAATLRGWLSAMLTDGAVAARDHPVKTVAIPCRPRDGDERLPLRRSLELALARRHEGRRQLRDIA